MGYLSFGKAVAGNIILACKYYTFCLLNNEKHCMYINVCRLPDPASLFVTGGRIAIVILVLLSYPLQCHPCRASLDKVLSARSTRAAGNKVPPPPSTLKFISITIGILVATYIVAMTMTKLDLVLAFVGSTGSTAISFILPALFYLKLHQDQPWTTSKIVAALLGVYGVCVMVICLSFNVMHAANPPAH
jgi:amino acid permease